MAFGLGRGGSSQRHDLVAGAGDKKSPIPVALAHRQVPMETQQVVDDSQFCRHFGTIPAPAASGRLHGRPPRQKLHQPGPEIPLAPPLGQRKITTDVRSAPAPFGRPPSNGRRSRPYRGIDSPRYAMDYRPDTETLSADRTDAEIQSPQPAVARLRWFRVASIGRAAAGDGAAQIGPLEKAIANSQSPGVGMFPAKYRITQRSIGAGVRRARSPLGRGFHLDYAVRSGSRSGRTHAR